MGRGSDRRQQGTDIKPEGGSLQRNCNAREEGISPTYARLYLFSFVTWAVGHAEHVRPVGTVAWSGVRGCRARSAWRVVARARSRPPAPRVALQYDLDPTPTTSRLFLGYAYLSCVHTRRSAPLVLPDICILPHRHPRPLDQSPTGLAHGLCSALGAMSMCVAPSSRSRVGTYRSVQARRAWQGLGFRVCVVETQPIANCHNWSSDMRETLLGLYSHHRV